MASERTAGYRKGLVDEAAGQVSREIFVNDEIYREELERVFARSWLFVGHESQIPNPGDFFVSSMGEESVILCRDRAGQIHVFLNSCRHRGMKVCRYDEGSTAVFTCPYHGWSYSTDGRLGRRPLFPRGLSLAARSLAMGARRGCAAMQLQGLGLGDLGPRRAALPRISRRVRELSRSDPRRAGRPRGPGRGARRRPEMADPLQLEISGGELQRRQLSQYQPPLGRSRRDRPERRRAPRHDRIAARPETACCNTGPRPSDDRLCIAEGSPAAAHLPALAGRLRIFPPLRRRAAAHPRRRSAPARRSWRNLPQCRVIAAPAAHDRGAGIRAARIKPRYGAGSSSIARRRRKSKISCATITSAIPARRG